MRPPTPGPNHSSDTTSSAYYTPAGYNRGSGRESLPQFRDTQREGRLDLRRVLASGLRKVRLAAAFAPHRRRHHLRELVRRHPRHEVGRDGREQRHLALKLGSEEHHAGLQLAAKRVGEVAKLVRREGGNAPREDLDAGDLLNIRVPCPGAESSTCRGMT